MINGFAPAFEVDLMWAQRPIVEKHHRYAFYQPFVERLASIAYDLPQKLALSFMLHIPIYFMANLRRTAKAFFIYWIFMLVNLIVMSMLFRMIGSVSKSRDGTMTPVSILSLLCVIYTGFVIKPPFMAPWLSWFRFVNPLYYTFEGLMLNEVCSALGSVTITNHSSFMTANFLAQQQFQAAQHTIVLGKNGNCVLKLVGALEVSS